MNKSDTNTRAAILNCLTEGMSIRATSRVTGASRGLVLRVLAMAGDFCEGYSFYRLRNLNVSRVEADEQWSFVGAKARNATQPGHGDVWTFCAIDADSKLVLSWLVGARSPENTRAFIADLAKRVSGRIQLTTDGFGGYLGAVRQGFEFGKVDFAQLIKSYGQSMESGPARRYSPPVCIGIEKIRRIGKPDMDLASTSYVERLNLNTRQNCRRFTRLTNAFSKSAENHARAVALNFFVHNFCRAHGTLTKAAGVKTTPAMAAGLTDRVWTVADIVARMDPETCYIK
ncbi:MAG: IS1 family transposase [Gemmatimonadales bacterium]